MCGRARCTLRPEEVRRACGIDDSSIPTVETERYRPSFNVSPGAYVPVVRKENGSVKGAVLHCMKWGLIPSFTKKIEKPDHFRMFNARSESICEKPSFRRLVPNNRCLVAVDGFYEWKKDGSKRQPYYIHFKDCRPLIFAALYDSWVNSEDRMPVILGSMGSADAWLNGSPSSKFDGVLKPYEDSDLIWHPVTPEMGKPSFDGPDCIKEIQLKPEEKNLISKFFTKTKTETKCELGPEVKSSSEEFACKDLFESLKEETDNKEMKELATNFEHEKIDVKPKVSTPGNSGAEKCGMKRDYEEFVTDSRLPTAITEKLSPPCSAKKKGNLKNAGDKQPTLLSYFGRS
ncbi:uncharacterized protein LOC131239712 isoform X2 [Magnolia sinica]|uniref:uncharacterized protein LOC131239712 isoform X2 n=1 Tax=Magnolia sinica TaxID=86752 RepID=UPI002657B0E1|nr:uncharacterized protein LOC131239712 isoform X2 [Magnolia sinica]